MLTRSVSLVRTQYRSTTLLSAKRLRQFRRRRQALPTGNENSRRFASQNRLRPLVAGLVN